MMALVLAAVPVPGAVVLALPCREPMTAMLDQRKNVEVDIVFACKRGERATIRWQDGDRCVQLTGNYVRGSPKVDRDSSRVFRLIDGDERANDLAFRNGRLEIRRGTRLVAVSSRGRSHCG